MKTNIEALVAALKQVDDGEYITGSVPGDEIVIDGRWEGEPLEGALTTHLVPLASLVKEQAPDGLYLRTGIADGTADDGRPFELSLAASGRALIFTIGEFGSEDRRTQIIAFEDLVEGLLRINGAGDA